MQSLLDTLSTTSLPANALASLVMLVGIVIACVAGIKSIAKLEGWLTVAANVTVSFALCTALVALKAPALWWQGLAIGALVAILSLCGDEYLKRLAGKAGKTTTVNVMPSDPPIVEHDIKPDPEASHAS